MSWDPRDECVLLCATSGRFGAPVTANSLHRVRDRLTTHEHNETNMKTTLTYPIQRALTLSALAAAMAMPVAAQQADEEVIVTARQRAESITDVPASITAFSAQDIERAGIERAEDFIALTPGVTMVNTAEVGDTQVSIRGINGTRDGEANFAFIVDGILYTNPSAFNREFADLKQIEVLKGPQGALYGRSASAGAIIVTTNSPTEEFSGHLKAHGGSQDSYFVSGAVSGTIVDDQLFGRLHGDWRTTDGFYKNNFRNDDKIVDDFENFNINSHLLWEPNEDLTFNFKGHYGEVDAAAIAFNAAFALPVFGSQPPGSPLYEDVNDHDFLFQPNINPSNEQDSRDFSVKMDWDLDWGATVTSWMLYSNVEQNFLTDGTSGAFGFFAFDPATSCPQTAAATAAAGVPFPAPTFNTGNPIPFVFAPAGSFYGPYTPTTCDGYQYQERNQEDLSFEIRLTSTDDERLRWQLGFYYLDLERKVGVATGVDPATDFPRDLISPFTEALMNDKFNTEVWAVFGNLQYDVTDDIEASLALRYDHEDREVNNRVPGPNKQRSNFIEYTPVVAGPPPVPCTDGATGSPLNPGFITDLATCATQNAIPDRDKVWDEIQPKISLRWDVTDDFTAFASWGRGFKSGGFNNSGSAATVDLFFNSFGAGLSISDEFDKETSDAFEVGFKSTIGGGRVQVDGALFYTSIDDMQIFNFFVGPFGLLRVVSNIDEVSIMGGELDASFDFNDQVTFYGGVSVQNGIIDKNRNRPLTVGNKVPYAPEYTLNFGGEFVEPNVFAQYLNNTDFVFRADYSVVGKTWFSEVQEKDQTPTLFTGFGFGLADWTLTKRDSFGIVNVRAGLESGSWGLHAFAKNLLNEEFLSEVIPAPEFGGSFIHPGTRRSWGIEMSYSF